LKRCDNLIAGEGARGSKSWPNAHPFVVSRHCEPCAAAITQVAQGVGNRRWSWVSAGVERRPYTTPASRKVDVLDAGAPGLVAGRHKALEACREDILIYLDDDVTLPAGWMESVLEPFADPDIHFVGCRCLPDYEHDPPSWLEALWCEDEDGFRTLPHLSLLDGGGWSRCYRPSLVWGLCFAARRETVIKLGGFNPDGYPWELRRFRGDGESALTLKAEMLGLKAFYQSKTHVNHRVPASRMTLEYFERRSFLQGISDSYTQIRRDHGVPTMPRRSWRDLVRPAKWKLERDLILRKPTAEGVQTLIARSHLTGMRFHRSEVCRDRKLLDWVLKENYFDYRLPDGWEQYLNA
jgi:glucosyl-dolichyl phosphate glucuronosyltransferase